jgi:hypothetical protein
MAAITLEDLNGKHYLGTQEGELLQKQSKYRVLIPEDMETADNPLEEIDIAEDDAIKFIRINASDLLIQGVTATVNEAISIAVHRLLAIKHGLISDKFVPANFHVDYNDAERLTAPEVVNIMGDVKAVTTGDVSNYATKQVKDDIFSTFFDRVCLVAFVFRARGHHYTDDYQDLYERVWTKCRYHVNQLRISFRNMATYALHGIYPIILDNFWLQCKDKGHCNGALSKRIDTAPAGAAGPYVLDQGIRDLVMIAPGIKDRLDEAFIYLNGILNRLREHRFNGSVNHRYYGADRITFDEKRMSAIAATIVAALDNLTEDSPLGKSPALRRIANNAPITGAVLGRAIGNIANRPEVVDTLLITGD